MTDIAEAPRPTNPLLVRRLCAFAELFGAALLVGGLIATGAVGLTAFRSPDLLTHEQAGRFMARIFEGSLLVEATAVFLVVAGGIGGALSGGKASPLLLLLPILCFAPVAAHAKLSASMRGIRERHGGTLEGLAQDDPDRREFGKLHGIYNGVALVVLGIGLASLGRHALRTAKGAE
ncbi:MAG TPA: hypothetical protein VHF22_08985 [Planctomycetota bacterium]|nr:hypothetical protein [Planctomycetota bacterium]